MRNKFFAVFAVLLFLLPINLHAEPSQYLEGKLRVIAIDSKDSASTFYELVTNEGSFELVGVQGLTKTKLQNNDTVKVRGDKLSKKILVDEIQLSSDKSPIRKALTNYRTLVVRFNYQNDQSQPFTPAELSQEIFTTTNNFYQESSYGNMALPGDTTDVTPWYTVPYNSGTGCSYNYGEELDQWTNSARAQAFDTGGTLPNYRFWSDTYQHHFFTSSEAEKNNVVATMPEWRYEGISNYVYNTSQPNTSPVYRFWSETYRSHFFTSSETEKNNTIANMPEWHYEGVAYYVFNSVQPNTAPVYRFWSETYRSHFFTSSETEKNNTIANYSDEVWHYEGVSYYNYLNQADAAMFNEADYDNFMYVSPDNPSCGWAGLGEVPGDELWSNGFKESELFSHEFGHNLGFGHAAYMDCVEDAIKDYPLCVFQGVYAEYGDRYDVMGGDWQNYHHNAIFKSWNNWIQAGEITTISGNGNYTVNPIEESGSAVKAAMILKPDPNDPIYVDRYWIEYRKATGFDSGMPAGATAGIMIRIEGVDYDPYNTYVLDLTPPNDWTNVVLTDGASFTDSENGITITQTGHDASGATFTVTFS